MTKKTMICYKSNGVVIYYSDPQGRYHFVPKNKWSFYIVGRKQTPFRCVIFNTKEEARLATIDHGDRPEVWGAQRIASVMRVPDKVLGNNLNSHAKDHLVEVM